MKKCNPEQWWNNDKCWCDCKKTSCIWKKIILGILLTRNCENGKHLASIMGNLTITCDEIIESYVKLSLKDDDEETKANFNEEKVVCKTKDFYILLAFLLIITALLIAVSNYCRLIKYQTKQKKLLPFRNTKLSKSVLIIWIENES